jgi:SAM-dependent methyltransferase
MVSLQADRRGFLSPIAWRAARFEWIRRIGFRFEERRARLREGVHPFDREYGVDTSGYLRGVVLRAAHGNEIGNGANSGYLGSDPGVIRCTLELVADHERTAFVDIGCGKGRALIVASEFPFRSITGIEISPELASIAGANAEIISRNFPQRPVIRVVTGDALDSSALPGGDLAIYLYHPFGESLVERCLQNIEYALAQETRSIYVIYNNPMWARVFDESPLLRRLSPPTAAAGTSSVRDGSLRREPFIVWRS